jgi:SOS-response transcriptional repressor LexA
MKLGLTKRQTEVLEVIKDLIEENAARGYSPKYKEIAERGGIKSVSNVHRYVHVLKERGHLDRIERTPQSITLL